MKDPLTKVSTPPRVVVRPLVLVVVVLVLLLSLGSVVLEHFLVVLILVCPPRPPWLELQGLVSVPILELFLLVLVSYTLTLGFATLRLAGW